MKPSWWWTKTKHWNTQTIKKPTMATLMAALTAATINASKKKGEK